MGARHAARKGPRREARVTSVADFKLVHGSEEIVLRPGIWIVGRANDASIQVASPSVSRRHALLRVTGTRADVLDLGSENGTVVNGVQVGAIARPLRDGDRMVFGAVEFEVRRQVLTEEAARARARAARTEPLDPGAIAAIADGAAGSRPERRTPAPASARAPARGAAPVASAARPAQRLVLAVHSPAWAEEIRTAASIHAGLAVETISAEQIRAASGRPGGGVLLLELYAASPDAFSLLRAWLSGGAGAARAVLLSNGIEEERGRVLAREMGAQGYVRAGKPGILVLAAARPFLQPAAASAEWDAGGS